jgi:hypothetical protein
LANAYVSVPAAAAGLSSTYDHEGVVAAQLDSGQLVTGDKQRPLLPLCAFVQAPRQGNDFAAAASSAVTGDFDHRTKNII